jgi:prevent-host-death family protein
MTNNRVTMTMLRQHLGEFVNRAAYGNERIILVSRGELRAAIISIPDLERLQAFDAIAETDHPEKSLAAVTALRERIRAWQESHEVLAGDVAADLNQLREERDVELSDMR